MEPTLRRLILATAGLATLAPLLALTPAGSALGETMKPLLAVGEPGAARRHMSGPWNVGDTAAGRDGTAPASRFLEVDGSVDFGELVDADILAIARTIVVRPPVPPPPIGDDAALRGRLAELQASITRAMAFTDDEDPPAVPLEHIQNLPTPASLLELVSEDPRNAAIGLLQATIGALDVRPPPDGDMAAVNQRVNERRKGQLLEDAEGLTELLRFGRLDALRAELRRLRTHAEWLVPATAEKIVRLVDRVLAAVG